MVILRIFSLSVNTIGKTVNLLINLYYYLMEDSQKDGLIPLFPEEQTFRKTSPSRNSTNEILIMEVRRELKKETELTFLPSAIRRNLIVIK